MENVFRVKKLDKIKIGEYFTKYKNDLCPSSVNQLPQTYDEIKQILQIDDDHSEELLEESISLNHLAQSDDIPVIDFQLHDLYAKTANKSVEIPPGAMHLRCIQQRLHSAINGTGTCLPQKYNRYRYIAINPDNADGNLKPFDDILITVRVYEPFVYKRGFCSNRKPRLSQEFYVLGRQLLSELRDKIYCQCQFGPFLDISTNYETISNEDAADCQPSTSKQANDNGFFFITDTFYRDTRTTDEDITADIREWIERKSDIGPIQIKSMENTKFEDLDIRLGFPQLFRHFINCEHIISFTDIRLLAPDDSLKLIDYPLLRCVSSSREELCIICGIMEATFVVRNCNYHIQDPAYLCRTCMISYHYIDGKKVGQFQAYRFYGNRPILN